MFCVQIIILVDPTGLKKCCNILYANSRQLRSNAQNAKSLYHCRQVSLKA